MLKKSIAKNVKRLVAISIAFSLIFTPLAQVFNIPLQPKPVEAVGNVCADTGGGVGKYLAARVGGVSLDEAATFLADMSDITGAYYDADQDRIVFVGQKNTALPKFDKDDMAVAIKSIVFNNSIPSFSLEYKDPSNPFGHEYLNAIYYGGIEDTNFGNVLLEADYKLKMYGQGYDENGNQIVSSVPGYKSFLDRYIEKGPTQGSTNYSRHWISPKVVTLKEDDSTNSFIFDSIVMEVQDEALNSSNDPAWNAASSEFVNHMTQHYNEFAYEIPSYTKAKQLAKIVAVIKWIKDNGVVNNFDWARDYQPKYIYTPLEVKRLTSPYKDTGRGFMVNITGGVDYYEPNTYNLASGAASSIKNASEAVATPTEETHWTFTKDGQQYESVAVTASAFRSLGSYSTAITDLSFPTVGNELTLAFQRVYSSFSGGQKGVGRGWDMIPTRLIDNKTGWTTSCASRNIWKLGFSTIEGTNETFTYTSCTTGYSADKPEYHSKAFYNGDGTYTIRRTDQVEYVFDASLKLTKIKDKNGNTLSYTYDAAGKLVSIADSQNHTVTLAYNPSNLITTATDWTNRTVRYGYDTQGNLTSVTDPRVNITTYSYDVNNKLTAVKNRLGQTVTENTYTPEAKVATQKDAVGTSTAYAYDEQNKRITITENAARTNQITYDDKARILQDTDALNKSLIYTYGVEYAPLTVTDKNSNKTTYTYDANGNMTSITFPNTKKITYEYDSKNRLTKISDGQYGITPKVTTYTYDATGNLTQSNEASIVTNFTYNQFGDPLSITNHLNKTTSFSRDAFGNPLTITDPLSKATTNEYDPIGRLTKKTDPEGKTISIEYDTNNNVTSETNATGVTTYVHDKENRLQKTTQPNNAVTEYGYNAASALTTVKDAATQTTSYGYDAYQNLTSQQDALNRTTTYLYDELNRQKQSTTPLGKVAKWEYDANGNATKRIDAANQAVTYTYDNLNRLKTITYPDSKTVNLTYDDRGNLTQLVDPAGTTKYEYDVFDRLTKTTNPNSQIISYLYDSIGNLTKVTYPDAKSVQYGYDANNRLKTVTDWNNQQTTYEYKGNGLLASRVFPNGVTSVYGYDAANRLVSLEHTQGAMQLAKYSYQRDSVGNITQVVEEDAVQPSPTPTPTATPTPTPSPTSLPDVVVTGISLSKTAITTSDYFDINVTIKNQGTANISSLTKYVGLYYDRTTPPTPADSYNDLNYFYALNAGQEVTVKESLVRFTTPGDHTIWILADRTNKVIESDETNNWFGPYTVTVTSSAQAPSLWAKVKETIAKLLHPPITFAQSAPLQRITSLTYDILERLTGTTFSDNTSQTYTYDVKGNRLSLTSGGATTSYSLDADDRLQTAGSTAYTYDASGNMVGVDSAIDLTLGYDTENRLVSYSSATPSNESAYTLTSSAFNGIDVGSYSAPTFVDIDNDGDQDLFIGESGGTMKYYKNTESATAAAYTLDSSFVGSIDVGSYSTPTFADIDGDGDQDLFVGRSTGEISFYRNTGTASSPTFSLDTSTFNSIDIGSYSAPIFADLDADGDKDLLSGELGGTVKYYTNTGSSTSPAYTANTTLFTGIDVGSYSKPSLVNFDKDGRSDLFIGNSSGTLSFYRNTGTSATPTFTLVSANFSSIDVGNYSAPTFIDIDSDNDQDLFIGEYTGVIKQYTAGPMPGPTTTYKYDGLGNRLEKTTGSSATRYINDVSGDLTKVLAETNTANAIQNYYTYGVGLISQGQAAITNRVYPLADGVGNTRLVTDSTGAVVASYHYDPFGNLRSGTGTSTTNYKFSGEQLDPETSLYFLRARYYDPTTGRFISRDPLKGTLTNPQSQNTYAYGLNNPNSYSDPTGMGPLPYYGHPYWDVPASCINAVYDFVMADGNPTNEVTAIQSGANAVYQRAQGLPNYVGITNDLPRRAAEQLASKGINIQAIPGLENLSRIDARALEQVLIEQHGLENLLNKINSISPANPVYEEAIKKGAEILEKIPK